MPYRRWRDADLQPEPFSLFTLSNVSFGPNFYGVLSALLTSDAIMKVLLTTSSPTTRDQHSPHLHVISGRCNRRQRSDTAVDLPAHRGRPARLDPHRAGISLRKHVVLRQLSCRQRHADRRQDIRQWPAWDRFHDVERHSTGTTIHHHRGFQHYFQCSQCPPGRRDPGRPRRSGAWTGRRCWAARPAARERWPAWLVATAQGRSLMAQQTTRRAARFTAGRF